MKKNYRIAGITGIIIAILIFLFLGFYSVPPMGALPSGITTIVVKSPGEPFFNSPDAVSLKRTGNVSLMTRATAIMEASHKTILLRLPYIDAFYKISIGNAKIDG